MAYIKVFPFSWFCIILIVVKQSSTMKQACGMTNHNKLVVGQTYSIQQLCPDMKLNLDKSNKTEGSESIELSIDISYAAPYALTDQSDDLEENLFTTNIDLDKYDGKLDFSDSPKFTPKACGTAFLHLKAKSPNKDATYFNSHDLLIPCSDKGGFDLEITGELGSFDINGNDITFEDTVITISNVDGKKYEKRSPSAVPLIKAYLIVSYMNDWHNGEYYGYHHINYEASLNSPRVSEVKWSNLPLHNTETKFGIEIEEGQNVETTVKSAIISKDIRCSEGEVVEMVIYLDPWNISGDKNKSNNVLILDFPMECSSNQYYMNGFNNYDDIFYEEESCNVMPSMKNPNDAVIYKNGMNSYSYDYQVKAKSFTPNRSGQEKMNQKMDSILSDRAETLRSLDLCPSEETIFGKPNTELLNEFLNLMNSLSKDMSALLNEGMTPNQRLLDMAIAYNKIGIEMFKPFVKPTEDNEKYRRHVSRYASIMLQGKMYLSKQHIVYNNNNIYNNSNMYSNSNIYNTNVTHSTQQHNNIPKNHWESNHQYESGMDPTNISQHFGKKDPLNQSKMSMMDVYLLNPSVLTKAGLCEEEVLGLSMFFGRFFEYFEGKSASELNLEFIPTSLLETAKDFKTKFFAAKDDGEKLLQYFKETKVDVSVQKKIGNVAQKSFLDDTVEELHQILDSLKDELLENSLKIEDQAMKETIDLIISLIDIAKKRTSEIWSFVKKSAEYLNNDMLMQFTSGLGSKPDEDILCRMGAAMALSQTLDREKKMEDDDPPESPFMDYLQDHQYMTTKMGKPRPIYYTASKSGIYEHGMNQITGLYYKNKIAMCNCTRKRPDLHSWHGFNQEPKIPMKRGGKCKCETQGQWYLDQNQQPYYSNCKCGEYKYDCGCTKRRDDWSKFNKDYKRQGGMMNLRHDERWGDGRNQYEQDDYYYEQNCECDNGQNYNENEEWGHVSNQRHKRSTTLGNQENSEDSEKTQIERNRGSNGGTGKRPRNNRKHTGMSDSHNNQNSLTDQRNEEDMNVVMDEDDAEIIGNQDSKTDSFGDDSSHIENHRNKVHARKRRGGKNRKQAADKEARGDVSK